MTSLSSSRSARSTKPPARVVVVDARPHRDGVSLVARVGRLIDGRDVEHGVAVLDLARHRLRLEAAPIASAGVRARVVALRGADVALVVIGQATGDAANVLRIAHACGCRRAIALVPAPRSHGAVDLVENLGRHLLLDSGFDADEVPTVTMGDADALSGDECARLLEVIDATILPRAAGSFAIVDGLVTEGVVNEGRVNAFAVVDGRLAEIDLDVSKDAGAGDLVELHNGRMLPPVVVSERFGIVRGSALAPADLDKGAHLFAVFGGRGGFVDVVKRGDALVMPSERGQLVVPVDGRVGIARLLGGDYWRVTSTAIPVVTPAPDAPFMDPDDTPPEPR